MRKVQLCVFALHVELQKLRKTGWVGGGYTEYTQSSNGHFLPTFHHDGKISQPGGGWGFNAHHYIDYTYPYKVVVYAPHCKGR